MEHEELVRLAIKGNEKAFETLVKQQSEKLYKTAFMYVRNKEDALDVLQETIYKAFISIEKVKQPEFFHTWLTKILIRTSFDLLRKRKKLVLDFTKDTPTKTNDIDGKIDLITAISKLSENYQTVIILFFYHDLPIRNIAEIMDIPENTVKTYLRRAKKELKHSLEGVNYFEQRAFQ